MAIYINGLSSISPASEHMQENFPKALPETQDGYLKNKNPDYKKYISPMALRRMSKGVKMGIFAANACLENAQLKSPDAIVTGTGLGCIEDTEKFLVTMIQNKEKLLNPTPFIQSTHNTVSSQISLFLKCHAYNITYAHKGLSFEMALMDSIMLINENESSHVLTGGIDEITFHSWFLQKRLGIFKNATKSDIDNISKSTSKGSVAGEGAAFFMISDTAGPSTYASIGGVKFWEGHEFSNKAIINNIDNFLKEKNLKSSDIDILYLGYSGNSESDRIYDEVSRTLFAHTPQACFKNVCGEYQTATANAMALAALSIKKQHIPQYARLQGYFDKPLKNILIYNHYQNINHSLIWLHHDNL